MKKRFLLSYFSCAFLLLLIAISGNSLGREEHVKTPAAPPDILIIIAHPDDETMFNLSRFKERGWDIRVALVTNGEGGKIIEAIKNEYDPEKDGDILIEEDPARGVWVKKPPDGPVIQEIVTREQLAEIRQKELINSLSLYGVKKVYYLSSIENPSFEDNWNNGVKNWNKDLLAKRLRIISTESKPDIIITLDPDETWVHPQHNGLGKIIQSFYEHGLFTIADHTRPELYVLREHGWYEQSWVPLRGDMQFKRNVYSPVLGMSYEEYWIRATESYMSQSSHPVWFLARIKAGIVPGYRNTDIIRRIDGNSNTKGLQELFLEFPPDSSKMQQLPVSPEVIQMSEYRE